jgi:hypothetical protein
VTRDAPSPDAKASATPCAFWPPLLIHLFVTHPGCSADHHSELLTRIITTTLLLPIAYLKQDKPLAPL